MNREQLAKEIVYDSIAKLLPALGRDFKVDIVFKPDGLDKIRSSIQITPLTELGKLIIPHLREHMLETMVQVTKDRGDQEGDEADGD